MSYGIYKLSSDGGATKQHWVFANFITYGTTVSEVRSDAIALIEKTLVDYHGFDVDYTAADALAQQDAMFVKHKVAMAQLIAGLQIHTLHLFNDMENRVIEVALHTLKVLQFMPSVLLTSTKARTSCNLAEELEEVLKFRMSPQSLQNTDEACERLKKAVEMSDSFFGETL